MSPADKPLVWLAAKLKTPPLSRPTRVELGYLLRRLQQGEILALPHSRPMPIIGRSCHELRIRDRSASWRIVYRIDSDAIILVDVFAKTTRATPKPIIDRCRARLRDYDDG